ncbi:phospholipase C [Phyllobacterium sp. YR620]|uniref:phosphocholine-specific phospholipase C n=1 Tax=Phyllobacterium sp. YR620 TaxID=1881066 RepID=UPI00088F365F|nr:phospholipase C, phosphocholine-specific [Phyllobacterium sp. YR620]SDP07108.1 phospholipase C [Phyllobacterium sp. YR620]
MSDNRTHRQMSRRKFMEMMGVSAGGVAGLSMLPPAIQQALAIPPNNATGTIRDVEHVVIMMQENRSLNHYFGTYNGVRGFTDPRPVVSPATGKDVFRQPITDSLSNKDGKRCGVPLGTSEVLPYPIDYDKTGEGLRGTDHGVNSGQSCWNHGRYDNWIAAKGDVLTMSYLRHKDVSYHRYLANAFTVCDHYFVSCHGDTIPNRQFLVSGAAANPALKNPKVIWPSWDKTPAVRVVSDWTTYPERIEKFNAEQTNPGRKITWRTYQGGTGKPGEPTDCYEENNLAYFAAYNDQPVKGCYWVDGVCYKDGKVYTGSLDNLPTLVRNGVTNRSIAQMREDVLNNQLPNISWVVAPYKNCEHPSATVTDGAYYINEVLSALVANPEVWSKTIFLLNYDENDGLFDHVVPPMPVDEKGPGKMSPSLLNGLDRELYNHENEWVGQYIGFGPRVPMLVVSPWSKGGWVCSEVFDHTSTLRFLEARFGLESDKTGVENPLYESNITPWRRAIAGDLTSAFDFAKNDAAFVAYPKGGPFVNKSGKFPPNVPLTNAMPKVENPVTAFGTDNTSNPDFSRRSRPLPYEFHINGHLDAAKKQLVVDFVNAGKAGSCFYAYDYVLKDQKPRRYSVIKGEPLQDAWDVTDKGYHLAIHGPNGYLRQFKGALTAELEVDPQVEILYQANGDVTLKLVNAGTKDQTLKITVLYDKIGSADRTPSTKMRPLKLLTCVPQFEEIKTRSGWYDITVELVNESGKSDGVYLRRFAGRVETGAASVTDPFLTFNNVETA